MIVLKTYCVSSVQSRLLPLLEKECPSESKSDPADSEFSENVVTCTDKLTDQGLFCLFFYLVGA